MKREQFFVLAAIALATPAFFSFALPGVFPLLARKAVEWVKARRV